MGKRTFAENRWLIDRLYVHENWPVNYETGL